MVLLQNSGRRIVGGTFAFREVSSVLKIGKKSKSPSRATLLHDLNLQKLTLSACTFVAQRLDLLFPVAKGSLNGNTQTPRMEGKEKVM